MDTTLRELPGILAGALGPEDASLPIREDDTYVCPKAFLIDHALVTIMDIQGIVP